MQSPSPSRATSPLPFFYSTGHSSGYSDSDSDSGEPAFPRPKRRSWSSRDRSPRWWSLRDSPPRRRGRDSNSLFRSLRRLVQAVVRLPYFPRNPYTILFAIILFATFATGLTLTLMYILNPDKAALPWRAYCTVPVTSYDPPPVDSPVTNPDIFTVGASPAYPTFPPDNFDALPPAGVFLGVFSMDSAVERRMLIRDSWASHKRSRDGAGEGDSGHGTSRSIVRFVLGQPRGTWERRVMLEMEQHRDIVILPMAENMNSGKSNMFFTWAATNAWVPPLYNASDPAPHYSYSHETAPAPVPAPHDPVHAREDAATRRPADWVRPDFVVKADDDSFVMLAELEARLRVAMHAPPAPHSAAYHAQHSLRDVVSSVNRSSSSVALATATADDPLVYWGYLVKQRFMAGELYALSWALVQYAATDENVKAHVRGAEDKTTASWMRSHPRADEIRWASERCWIYDHPKAGTVYSHGFLFPSEASRVRKTIKSRAELSALEVSQEGSKRSSTSASASVSAAASSAVDLTIPPEWALSTVQTFGTRYAEPVPGLTTSQSIEALVEGSEMSRLHDGSVVTPEAAWRRREGRAARYEGSRLGGTVVVHFVKKNLWYQETALALLGGDEETELERERRLRPGAVL